MVINALRCQTPPPLETVEESKEVSESAGTSNSTNETSDSTHERSDDIFARMTDSPEKEIEVSLIPMPLDGFTQQIPIFFDELKCFPWYLH